jgi:hypothetical protein
MVHWWVLVHCGQRKRISMVNSNYVIQYPSVHHPLEAHYNSIVDELQLSFTLVTYPLPSVGWLLKKTGTYPAVIRVIIEIHNHDSQKSQTPNITMVSSIPTIHMHLLT